MNEKGKAAFAKWRLRVKGESAPPLRSARPAGRKEKPAPFLSSSCPLNQPRSSYALRGSPGSRSANEAFRWDWREKAPERGTRRLKIRFAASLLRARSPLGAGGRGARSPVPPRAAQAQAHRPAPRTSASGELEGGPVQAIAGRAGRQACSQDFSAAFPFQACRGEPSGRAAEAQGDRPESDPWRLSVEAACQKSSAGDSGARAPSDRLWPAFPLSCSAAARGGPGPLGSLLTTAGQHQPGKEERRATAVTRLSGSHWRLDGSLSRPGVRLPPPR